MFKRLLIVCTAAVIALSSLTAMADGTNRLEAGDELTRITLAVKEAVEIGDGYENFSGSYEDDGPVRRWRLSWYGGMESVDVVADDDGKVLSYNYYNDSAAYVSYSEDYAPAFPATSRSEAQSIASEFVRKVLGDGEGFVWHDTAANVSLGATYYTFDGVITRNGIPTETGLSVRVRVADAKVSRFSRDDSYQIYYDRAPASSASFAESSATEKLEETVNLELRYVISDTDEKSVVLRYVPVKDGDYIVNATSGELVNLDDLFAAMGSDSVGSGDTSADTGNAESGSELTPEEMEGISKLEGVISSELLDAGLREIIELGVSDEWNLSSAVYTQPDDNGDVFCTMVYLRTDEETDRTYVKNIHVNAKSEELISMYTSTEAIESPDEERSAELETIASNFAGKFWTERAAAAELRPDSDGGYRFTYCQYVNGVPFYNNYYTISVDPASGEILSFSGVWEDGYQFESASGVITAEVAKDAYLSAFDTRLVYVDYPVVTSLTSADQFLKKAAQAGYPYVHELCLCYRLESDMDVYGVGAKTGEVLVYEPETPGVISYSDLSQSYAVEQVTKLAEYGIGYAGGKLRPRDSLTQLDMLGLFMGATGVDVSNLGDPDVKDYVYSLAYGYGMLEESERDDDAVVTREQFMDCLISGTEYGAASKLTGIYKTGFSDDGSIAESCRGAVAIAKVLGLVSGDSKGAFNPQRAITRQDAAIVLYKFMSR